jgi:hypothetical protein
LNVLGGKFSVTNSLLNNCFEYSRKFSPIFEARRFNFRLDRLGDKGMRRFRPNRAGLQTATPRPTGVQRRCHPSGQLRDGINLAEPSATTSTISSALEESAVQRSQRDTGRLGNGVHLGIAKSEARNHSQAHVK